jgi:hypothetical protein
MLISIFGISAGRAQETVDVAKITCGQFLTAQFDPQNLSIWLGGYYNGTQHNTVVDVSAFKQHSADVFNYCISHRDMTLMEAAQNVLGAKK